MAKRDRAAGATASAAAPSRAPAVESTPQALDHQLQPGRTDVEVAGEVFSIGEMTLEERMRLTTLLSGALGNFQAVVAR